jgi:hypothetical protein
VTVTPDFLYGADSQSTAVTQFGGSGTGIWDSTSTTSAFTFIAGRVSGTALHVVETGAAICYLSRIPVASQHQVGAFWFRVPAAPVLNNSCMFFFVDPSALLMGRFDIADTGIIRAAAGSGVRQNGPQVDDNAWHLLTFHNDTSATTWTMHWSVDGVAQTNATQSGKTATNVFKWRIGTVTNTENLTFDIDDFVYGHDDTEYPYYTTDSNHQVVASFPNADGSHLLGLAITTNSGGTTNLYQTLDDTWPPTTTDYVRQTIIGALNYAEIAFTDATGTPAITAVQGTMAGFSQSGTAPNAGTTSFFDGSGNALSTLFAGDMVFTSVHYQVGMITAPGAGWTSGFDGLVARIGYSADVTPNPRWTALMVEYLTAVTVLSATAAVTVTAAPAVTSMLRTRFGTAASTGTATVSANLTIISSVITGHKYDTTDEDWDDAVATWDGATPNHNVAAQVGVSGLVAATLVRTALTISATVNVTGTAAVSGIPSAAHYPTVDVPVSALVEADITATAPGAAAVTTSVTVTATPLHTALATAAVVVNNVTVAAPFGSSIFRGVQKYATYDPTLSMRSSFDATLRKGASTLGVKSPITKADNWFVGEDQTFEFTVVSSGAVNNITGWTLSWRLAPAAGDASILTIAGAITSASGGVFTVTLAAVDTASLDPDVYYYDVSRTDAGFNQVLAFGAAHLQARVA